MFWHTGDQKTQISPLIFYSNVLICIARLESTGCDEVSIGIPSMAEDAAAEVELELELLICNLHDLTYSKRFLASNFWRRRLYCPTYELFQAVVWKTHT